jgi:S-DNA-T family DNA segregation ATPase FtsK/SpoIIIE
MVAATQRPTQKAMGQGAVRSQMDIRTCFRVRERKDVDLILGQGMLTAGWHAHTLNAPGKFLISAPEHSTPRRARGYLLTDQTVADTAAQYAGDRPTLDRVSQLAIEERAQIPPDDPAHLDDATGQDDRGGSPDDTRGSPEAILWAALSLAPPEGITVPELMDETGMSRPWVYQRLQELARRGQVAQVSRGRWHATGGDAL